VSVHGIPKNVYQGFESHLEAEQAYLLAFALGCLRTCSRRGATLTDTPADAMPKAVMESFAAAADDFLGAEWHVVFKGKCPGVYTAWFVFYLYSVLAATS
jgi:hypothetical protein